MESLECAGVVNNVNAEGHPSYQLTTGGRDWWLDALQRGLLEQQQQQAIADFEPNETQKLAVTVLVEKYPRAMNVGQIRVEMDDMTELNVIVSSQAEIARELERLAGRNVLTISDGAHPRYELTVPGRNFMLKVLDADVPPR